MNRSMQFKAHNGSQLSGHRLVKIQIWLVGFIKCISSLFGKWNSYSQSDWLKSNLAKLSASIANSKADHNVNEKVVVSNLFNLTSPAPTVSGVLDLVSSSEAYKKKYCAKTWLVEMIVFYPSAEYSKRTGDITSRIKWGRIQLTTL